MPNASTILRNGSRCDSVPAKNAERERVERRERRAPSARPMICSRGRSATGGARSSTAAMAAREQEPVRRQRPGNPELRPVAREGRQEDRGAQGVGRARPATRARPSTPSPRRRPPAGSARRPEVGLPGGQGRERPRRPAPGRRRAADGRPRATLARSSGGRAPRVAARRAAARGRSRRRSLRAARRRRGSAACATRSLVGRGRGREDIDAHARGPALDRALIAGAQRVTAQQRGVGRRRGAIARGLVRRASERSRIGARAGRSSRASWR